MVKETLKTRWLLWKRNLISLLFWFLFPFIMTIISLQQINQWQEDAVIPIGFVVLEESDLAQQLYNQLQETPHLHPIRLGEQEALHQLEKHELDSVFILHEDYERNIKD